MGTFLLTIIPALLLLALGIGLLAPRRPRLSPVAEPILAS
jgi:hypothetical protein